MSEPLSERALERRLKRHLRGAPQSFFASCAPGFEDVLENEVKRLPLAKTLTPEAGGISFTGSLEGMYFANLQLRTAHRVLLRIDDFLAQSYPMLFDHARKIPWELYIGFSKTYKLQVSAKSSRLRQHKNIEATLTDAIKKRLEPLGCQATANDDADLVFYIRLFQDRCTVSIDTSGVHLHKRGYRTHVSEAPLRETLAAASLLAINAKPFTTIIDPMCGSGTFLIEEAMLAKKQAPGLHRNFAFEHFPSFQESKWLRFKQESIKQQVPVTKRLIGLDITAKNIEVARHNAEQAAVTEIHFEQADALHFSPSRHDPASTLIISNVPYGNRLGSKQSIPELLNNFATHMASSYKGCHFAFISKKLSWLESPAFEVQEKRPFSNGGLDVQLVKGRIKK